MKDFRADFPIFSAAQNESLIYFDNAATSQKPSCVLDAMRTYYDTHNANPLRGLYDLSVRATDAYENARTKVAHFINAHEDCEIVFTRNASESLNLIAYTYGLAFIESGDEIVISSMEHHSNILPWQMLCERKGARLVWLECDKETGTLDMDEVRTKITDKTKIVSVTHVSNVLGTVNPVKEIAAISHEHGAIFIGDGAQSTPHMKVDVRDLDVDFYVFSSHKMCGPMGIGVLYGKKHLLEKMPPFLRGGEMIEYVTRESATWAALPAKFEAGTVNAGGAVGLGAAVDYLSSIGMDKIAQHEVELCIKLTEAMKTIPHVNIIGNKDGSKRSGIVSFTIDDVHPHDIATVLDTEHIAIRAGHHCAQPLGAFFGAPATARASLYFYNTESEVDKFVDAISHVRSWMGL